MSEPELEVVAGDAVSDELVGELVSLFEAAFGRWPSFELAGTPAEYLRWKLEGPGARPSSVILARLDGRLAGAVLAYWRRYLVRGTERLARDMVDSGVHPEAQGAGLYSAIRWFASEQFDPIAEFTIGYSTNAAVRHTRSGGKQRAPANPPRVLICPLDAGRTARLAPLPGATPSVVVSAGIRGLVLWNRLRREGWSGLGRGAVAAPELEVRTLERFDASADALFERAASQFEFAQVRDAALLNWRYRDPRGGRFLVRAVHDGDVGLLGFVVLKMDGARGYVVDLLVEPDREDVAAALLADAVAQFRDASVAYAICWMTRGHPQLAAARAAGFLDWRREGGCAVGNNRLPAGEVSVFEDPGAVLHLTQGDSDWL